MAEELFDFSRDLLDPKHQYESVFQLGWLLQVILVGLFHDKDQH
jgi:hypothetical protein